MILLKKRLFGYWLSFRVRHFLDYTYVRKKGLLTHVFNLAKFNVKDDER